MALALGVVSVPISAAAGEWSIDPVIEISETYTDNVRLDMPGAEEDDFVTEYRGGLRISGEGRRASVYLNYTPSYLIFLGENEEDFRHSLDGRITTELIRNHFFVAVNASVHETLVSPEQDISVSTRNITGDRRQTQVYTVVPRWEHQFGMWANATLSYRFQYTAADEAPAAPGEGPLIDFSDTRRHEGVLSIRSGRSFQRLRWSLRATTSHADRSQGGDEEDYEALLNLTYQLDRKVALTGSIGYRDLSAQSLTGGRQGIQWDAGVILTPSRKTRLTATYGEDLDNKRVRVSGSYSPTSRTSLGVNYDETYRTSERTLGDLLTGGEFQDGVLVDPNTGLPVLFDPNLPLTTTVFREDRFSFFFTHSKGRTSLSLTTYIEDRTFDTRPQESAVGITLGITREISRHVRARVTGNYINRQFDATLREDDIYFVTARLDYDLEANLTGYLSYDRTRRYSTDFTREIEENAVTVGLSAVF